MQTTPMPQTELTPPPPPLTPSSEKSTAPTEIANLADATPATAQAPDPELLKQLKTLQKRDQQMRHLGQELQDKERQISAQETAVATVTAKRKEEMEKLTQLENEKKELNDDLAKLAAGGFVERLPLGAAEPKAAPRGTAAQAMKEGLDKAAADRDMWKSVRLAGLEPTIEPGKIAVLFKHSPSIVTLGDLDTYRAASGPLWWKNLKGFGKKGFDQVYEAEERYFKANPRHVEAPPAPAKLTPRPATEEELKAGEFIPETAAHLIALLGPPLTPLTTADDILTNRYAFLREWHACEANAPGTKNAAKSSFNAEGWTNLQKAAAVLKKFYGMDAEPAAPAPGNDDAAIDPASIETAAEVPILLNLQVARRVGGRWAYSVRAGYATKKLTEPWSGNYATNFEAMIRGADKVDDWLPKSGAMLPKSSREQTKSIRAALDAMDKRIVKESGKSADELRGLTSKPEKEPADEPAGQPDAKPAKKSRKSK